MKRRYVRYSLPVLLAFAGMLLLVFTGMDRMSSQDLSELRRSQLKKIQLDSDGDMEALLMLGDIAVEDYFQKTSTGYRYLGGIYDAPWLVGETYRVKDLTSGRSFTPPQSAFYSRKIGEQSLYINIDRGDERTAKDFLKTMDQQGVGNLDTLVIDFRFLGQVDFGAVLRLFNQLAPRDRFELGTSISDYQETKVTSSGRPFFTSNITLFLVDPLMADAVKRLVINLSKEPGYTVLGNTGSVADTVCLFTDFVVAPEFYRICTEKWTDEAKGFTPDETAMFLKDSLQIDLLREVDEHWYKKRDSAAMAHLIPGMLQRLLP